MYNKRKITKYQKIVLALLARELSLQPSSLEMNYRILADKKEKHYQLVAYGWENFKGKKMYLYQVLLHFYLTEAAILEILVNKTELPLEIELPKLGISLSELRPLFIVPEERGVVGYAS
ncbi:MAG: element excision factor XisI family protein [Bacteroidia bacterium]